MNEQKANKRKVWLNLYKLVQPYSGKLSVVLLLSILGTSVTLLQPLIYREAVNDLAGLFVGKGREDFKPGLTDSEIPDESPEIPFTERIFSSKISKPRLRDTFFYTYDTIYQIRDTAIVKKVKHRKGKRGSLKAHTEKIKDRRIVRQRHTSTYVAPRTPAQAFDTLLSAVILLLVINVTGILFWWAGENINARLSSTIERNFISRTFSHVLKLPLGFFGKRSSAALHKQIDQSEEISGTVTYLTKDIFPEIITLAGIMVIMFWQNYILALLALSVVPVYLLITIRSTKKLELSLAGYYQKWEEVSARMQDSLAGIKTVKLSGAEDREVVRLNSLARDAYRDYMRRSFLSNKYSFWQMLLTHLASALVLGVGGYFALNQRLTPGDVVMFVAYMDMLYSPIDNLAGIWADIQQNVTSIGRAFKLLDNERPLSEGKDLNIVAGEVEFKNVHFSYDEERPVLRGVSFVARPGTVTAIVGSSGAGKTTAVDLLLKLFEPQQGEILIDGQGLSTLDESAVRRSIGMVSADGAIFRGTLADNIRYKRPEATDQDVESAALAAGLRPTLNRLPDGLQTQVGESGFGLSVGERQRIQIARVIVDRPRILVLDEATANLDYATEALVRQTIDEIKKKSTVIIIAHRYSMIKDAGQIFILEEGKVTEAGTAEELITNNAWFAKFADPAMEQENYEDSEEATPDEDEDE